MRGRKPVPTHLMICSGNPGKRPNTGLPIQLPYLPVVNKQAQILLRAAEQLGFSPSSRSRVQVVDDSKSAGDDEWDFLDRLRSSGA